MRMILNREANGAEIKCAMLECSGALPAAITIVPELN